MWSAVKFFFCAEGARPWPVVLCLAIAGVLQGVGIGSLLPAINSLTGNAGQNSKGFSAYVTMALDSVGLSPTLGTLVLTVSALLLAKSAVSFAAMSYAGVVAADVSAALRRELMSTMFAARWAYFTRQHVGSFANAVSNDATRAASAYNQIALFLSYLIQAAGYIVVGLLINWRISLAGLAAGLLIAGLLNGLMRTAKRSGLKQTTWTSEIAAFTTGIVSNIKPLKTMSRHEPTMRLMQYMLDRLHRSLVKQIYARQGLEEGANALIVVIIAAGVYFAASILSIALPELIVMGIVFFQAVSVTNRAQKHLQGVLLQISAYENVCGVIEEARSEAENHAGEAAPRFEREIRFESVSFAHDGIPVVSDANFVIPARSITVLQGQSGAGKTTIADLLVSLYRPDSGTILVDSVPLDQLDMTAWRRSIGYVPQELSLLHGTARENITLGDQTISDDDIWHALRQAGAGDFVGRLPQGLDTNVGEMGSKLSGGQRQRISLARALVIRPKLLILDEVTSALDPETEAEICRQIAALSGEFTILAITHRPAWIRIASHLYKVEEGGVTEALRVA